MKHLVLSLLTCLLFVACEQKHIQTYSVKQGTFQQTFVETGELAAIKTWTYVMPSFGRYWTQMRLIGLLDHGTEVQEGDSIIQFDPADVNRTILNLETELETQEANLDKMLLNQVNAQKDIEVTLQTEEASFSLKKLNMESSRFESERTQQIRKLEFQQSEIQYEKTKKRIKTNQIISENDLKIQRIRVRQIKEQIKDAYAVLPQLKVASPINGIFQVARARRGRALVKLGDDIYRGSPVGSIPDLSWMRVTTTVDEADYFKIAEGMRVNVRLDAIPDVVFPAEITYMGKLCRPNEDNTRQKVFDVELNLLVSDQRLKPGMTVSCEFLSEALKDVLYVPTGCVESTASGNYVYVKKGQTFERIEVDAGPANNTQVVIRGDVKAGDMLALVKQVERKDNE